MNNLEQLALVNIGTCTRLKKSNHSHLTCTKICIFLLCSTFVSAFGLFWTTSLQQIWNYQYLHVLPHNQVSERLVPDIDVKMLSPQKRNHLFLLIFHSAYINNILETRDTLKIILKTNPLIICNYVTYDPCGVFSK